jgi:ribosomal protein S18 acetylase RimI-like enzyme
MKHHKDARKTFTHCVKNNSTPIISAPLSCVCECARFSVWDLGYLKYRKKNWMSADPTQLERPFWSALTTTHSQFALGNDLARRYQPDVAPMAAIREVSDSCLQALIALMKRGDVVGLFSSKPISAIRDLVVVADKMVEQMVYDGNRAAPITDAHVNLTPADVPEMMHLVELTKPGPFSARTIALGSYVGIRTGGQLVAMDGERMRFDGCTEISAVCTHPDHRRRGHSSLLVNTLMQNVLERGERQFLHIYSDNMRAAALYRHLGFTHRRSITVTVLGRRD